MRQQQQQQMTQMQVFDQSIKSNNNARGSQGRLSMPSDEKQLNHSWVHHSQANLQKNSPYEARQSSYDGGRILSGGQNNANSNVSSSVDLSAKFSRQNKSHMHPDTSEADDKRRSNTLEAKRNSSSFYTSHNNDASNLQSNYAKTQGYLIEANGEERALQQQQQQENHGPELQERRPAHYNHINDCIQEEMEQSSSIPSQQLVNFEAPSQELIEALDFSFFRNVYNAYNTIWQHVLKLPVYGENYVQQDDFIRVLQSTTSQAASGQSNIFCNFLIFSCTSQMKQPSSKRGVRKDSSSGKQSKLVIDFRLFLKSVFMTLKRQFNKDQEATQESIFYAEMFLVDHFWQYICQSEHLIPTSDKSNPPQVKDDSERNTVESIPMDLLQRKLFEFFDRKQAPYLLQINEIEFIVTESFKNLIERNKRKDLISKRTFKKVISRQCHGILSKALQSFIPTTAKKFQKKRQQSNESQMRHSNLVPHSIPLSSQITNSELNGTTSFMHGSLIDHNPRVLAVRQKLQPKSLPKTQRTSGSYDASANASCRDQNRDQKSITAFKDQPYHSHQKEQRDERKQIANQRSNTQKRSQSLPASKILKRNLCKQLETKIVIKKLQSALDSFMTRLAFTAIQSGDFPTDISNKDIGLTSRITSSKPSNTLSTSRLGDQSMDKLPSSMGSRTTSDANLLSSTDRTPIIYGQQQIPIQKAFQNIQKRQRQSYQKPQQQQQQQQAQQYYSEKAQIQSHADASRHIVESHVQASTTAHTYQNSAGFLHKNQQHHLQQPLIMNQDQNHSSQYHQTLFSYQEAALMQQVHQDPTSTTQYESSSASQIHKKSDEEQQNYQTSCFQDIQGVHGQKGTSKSQLLLKQSSSQDISDQKLASAHESLSKHEQMAAAQYKISQQQSNDINNSAMIPTETSEEDSSTMRSEQQKQQEDLGNKKSATTKEMLKNILQHETKNHECLQELVHRVINLEESNKVAAHGRKDSFQMTQHISRDNIVLRSPPNISPQHDHDIMTFQPDTCTSADGPGSLANQNGEEYQQQAEVCYEQNMAGIQINDQANGDQSYPQSSESARYYDDLKESGNEFTHRQTDQEIILQMAQTQLEQAQRNSIDPQQMMQQQHSSLRSSNHRNSLNSVDTQSIGQLHSQEVDLGGVSTSDHYYNNQQQLYEVSKEEDRMCNIPYNEYGDEGEMDFEANKEQRPLQIVRNSKDVSSQSLPYLSSVSDQQSNRQIIQSNTISDPYINTNVQSNDSTGRVYKTENGHNNPYVMTSNNSQSQGRQTRNGMLNVYQNHHTLNNNPTTKIIPYELVPAKATLSYTVSDSQPGASEIVSSQDQIVTTPDRQQIATTSAPNLQLTYSNTHEQRAPMEQPYSNRLQEKKPYDSHKYVQSDQTELVSQNSQKHIHLDPNSMQNTSQELLYLKKYKKVKKHLKTLVREKREVEDRSNYIIGENTLLQNHLEKTAQSAQEVSNHNSLMRNELHVQKLFFIMKSLFRSRKTHEVTQRQQFLRKSFLSWKTQSTQLGFLSQQHEHQEMILSELSRQESTFKSYIDQLQSQIQQMQLKQRADKLKSLIRSRVILMRVKAFSQWKNVTVSDADKANQLNLQEDLRHVVTQLNQFRIQLVFSKLKSAIQKNVHCNLRYATDAIRESILSREQHNQSVITSQGRPPVYKSPFMQYLTRKETADRSFTQTTINNPGETIQTVVANNSFTGSVGAGAAPRDRSEYKRHSSDGVKQQNMPSIAHRSQSSNAIFPKQQAQLITIQKKQQLHQHHSQDVDHDNCSIDKSEENDDRPMAHRTQINQVMKFNQRSKSDNRSSKKEDFRMRMGDRMHKMRTQGKLVDGLAKLHGLFSKMKERQKLSTQQIIFKMMLSYGVSHRRRYIDQLNEMEENRKTTDRQSFPQTQKYRSSSHNLPGMASYPEISLNSSNSYTNCGVSSFKVSTGSLQFGYSNLRETPPNLQPHHQKPPFVYNKEFSNLQQVRETRSNMKRQHHARTSSEIQLEAPRIMMNISPSMHNINAPDLIRSVSTMQFHQAAANVNLKRKGIPKPNVRTGWLP